MELSISHSSFVLPSIIPPDKHRTYKASSTRDKYRLTTKNMIRYSKIPSTGPINKLIKPVGLYSSKISLSKSLLYGQHKHNSLQVRAQVDPAGPSVLAKILRFGSTCIKFSRPYSMILSLVAPICLFARVLVENPRLFTWSLLSKAFPSLLVVILSTAYITGINDIFDVDIDRVNKPYLPIPAGELSIRQACFLVTFDVLASLLILRMLNADLITTSLYCLYLFILTAYCAPPIRFKRSPIATIVLLSLSAVLQIGGVLYATTTSLGLPFWWSPPIAFIMTFAVIFYMAICITKDLTDVEGDIKHNVQTFAAMYGYRNIAFLGTGLLLVNYIGAIVCGICMPQAFKLYVMLPAHAIFALVLLFQARKLKKANYAKEASANFYQFLWKLLLFEYLLFPFT